MDWLTWETARMAMDLKFWSLATLVGLYCWSMTPWAARMGVGR